MTLYEHGSLLGFEVFGVGWEAVSIVPKGLPVVFDMDMHQGSVSEASHIATERGRAEQNRGNFRAFVRSPHTWAGRTPT
jgi:hypothetical protein